MKRKVAWLMMSCLVALSLLLAACAPAAPVTPTTPTTPTTPITPTTPAVPETETPKYGGTLNLVEPGVINTFAPVLFEATRTGTLTNEVLYGGDWTKGPAGTNEAAWLAATQSLSVATMRLAESYELVGNDTIIFHIRQGVRYALNPDSEASRLVNGRELTADDVARSLSDGYFDPEGVLQTRYTAEQREVSFKALDKYTLEIKTKPEILSATFYWVGESSTIYPPEVYDKYNKMRDWRHSVGTGPYILTEVVEGSSATLVKNPDYWEKDPIGPGKGSQLPYLESIKFLMISDLSTRQSAFRTGKLDIIAGAATGGGGGFNSEDAQEVLRTRPDLQYFSYVTRNPVVVGLRIDRPELPWYDLRVRQALVMAIDYNTIIKDYFKGEARLIYPVVPWPEYLSVYTPLEEQNEVVRDMYTYQPEKAKQILAEAGYPNGFNITVLTTSPRIDDLSVMQAYWQKISVNMQIDVRENAVFTSITNGKQHEEAVGTTFNAGQPFNIEKWQPGTASNLIILDNPLANELVSLVVAEGMFNEAAVWPVMKEFFQYATEQAWYIEFPAPHIYNMWQPWVKNYHGEHYSGVRGPWLFVSKYSWIDQELKKSMGY